MSRTNDPDLSDHLRRENAYADAFMADTAGLRGRLTAEMEGRIPQSVSTPPERWGPWLYYQYVPEGKEYPVLCRRLERQSGWVGRVLSLMGREEEEILLDWNEIAEQFGYVHVGTCRVSPDHKFLAYTLDITGGESFVLQVKNLETKSIIMKSRIEQVVSLAWSTDSHWLLYSVCDDTQRPYRVLCMELGSNVADSLLYTENDPQFCVDITSTKDGRFITINSNSKSSSEEGHLPIYVIDGSNLQNRFWPVKKRVPGVQYFLEHHHGCFYVLTNAPSEYAGSFAGHYYIARCKDEELQLASWHDVILPGQDVTFQDMDIFDGHLVLFLQRCGVPMLCSIDMPIDGNIKKLTNLEDFSPWYFPVPSNLCSILPGSNHDYMTSIYRVVLSSPVMPDVVIDYDMVKRTFSIVHREEVVGLNSQSWSDFIGAFTCERREVIAHDGVRIPLTILYSQKILRDGSSPGILYGYGAYGDVLDKSWCSDRISLLDRGWVIAFADVRGGGGQGVSWHQSGAQSCKLNSIYDFVACGTYLGDEGYVHKDRLSAIGCSAGGLLVGAAINMYPNLFRAAILKVPFLDICNTMLDPSLPLTILDYEEFGDPNTQADFETIRSYSPYDNILPGVCYPSMLVTASFHDSRVGIWEATKWVAKVRDITCPNCARSVILKVNMNSGHFSEGGLFKHCEDTAFKYAFLIKAMGMLDENQFESDS
ncbi:hypothetical protein QJS04_geneDACA016534 [Acorus gramineus]|uniref:Prolyl endopeptidase n=1 Tax=Acorus gramineus TaxID=55184 RepID=A0AAV9B8U8_ACOGR|nr:hypothetical protein QJS04_geneDACA016534 [Acorus gramineus]